MFILPQFRERGNRQFSGVCKVNAAIAAQLLIDVFCVDIIINSGTAGGMEPELEIFDTVISTEVCYL